MSLPKPIQDVINEFCRLPGIGRKSAERLAFYLVRNTKRIEEGLGNALLQLKQDLTFCNQCHTITVENPCETCSNPHRDSSMICVVEEPLDVTALEKTGQFKGLYHVLHGVISPIDGVGPQDLKIAELVERVQTHDHTEVILALNPSLEGEATAAYIQKALSDLPVLVTRIARGLPIGADLEYADDKTLAKALEGRHQY